MSLLSQLKPIQVGLTPQEICVAAGIDYQIQKMPLSYFDGENHQEIDGKYAIVNEQGKVLGVCSKYWDIFQNLDIVTTAYETFKELGLDLTYVGEFAGGKRIACVGNWNKSINVGVGDKILGKVMLIGSHEVGIGHELRAYFERLVCTNGMTRRIRTTKQIYGHSSAGVKALTQALSNLDLIANEFEQNAQKLASTPITYEEALVRLIKEFGNSELSVEEQPKVVKTVLKLFSGEAMGGELLTAYNTAWGLLNCLTEYYSHHTNPSDRLKSFVSGCYGNNINRLQNSLISYSESPSLTIPVRAMIGV